jgi:hypothetical protein
MGGGCVVVTVDRPSQDEPMQLTMRTLSKKNRDEKAKSVTAMRILGCYG